MSLAALLFLMVNASALGNAGLTASAAPTAPGPWDSPAYPTQSDFFRILSRFPAYGERGWHANYHGESALGYFGDGRSDENGQRTLANFILTYAWLTAQKNPQYSAWQCDVSRQTVRDHAVAAFRYWYRTHVTGDLKCTDDKKWGDYWQSAWWTSRVAPATVLLKDDLTAEDQAAFNRVLIHEADRHIGLKPRFGEYGDTKSEENAWDAEVVAWALARLPKHPHAAGWRAALNQLLLNTFSTKSDTTSNEMFDGKPIKNWIGGPSIHPDYTIENHGPFHMGYQICPQHSFAWVYYAFASTPGAGAAPKSLEHHWPEVWAKAKSLALPKGRFAYVGGKDWPRYAYGMYFVLPALVYQELVHHDADARLLERQRVGAFEREQLHWHDGSFFSGRFTHLQMNRWPAEWETDCAANLTISALMHKLGPSPYPSSTESLAARNLGLTVSPYCEFIARRDPLRFASWCWRSMGGHATGLIGSDQGEDMMEWSNNLVGGIAVAKPLQGAYQIAGHKETTFAGGFATVGQIYQSALAEKGKPNRAAVAQKAAYIALPDGRTCLLLKRWTALQPATVTGLDMLGWYVVNDLFNDNRRTVASDYSALPSFELLGTRAKAGRLVKLAGTWVDVDRDVRVASLSGPLSWDVWDTPARDIQPTICLATVSARPIDANWPKSFEAGQTIAQVALALRTHGDLPLPIATGDLKPTDAGWAGNVVGADGKVYDVAVDYEKQTASVKAR